MSQATTYAPATVMTSPRDQGDGALRAMAPTNTAPETSRKAMCHSSAAPTDGASHWLAIATISAAAAANASSDAPTGQPAASNGRMSKPNRQPVAAISPNSQISDFSRAAVGNPAAMPRA